MGLVIECPYFQSEKRRTITCEGCLRFFQDLDKKKGYLKNICEKNYENCKYAQKLRQTYLECEKYDAIQKSLKLKAFYLEENRKAVKYLVQQIGIMDKNIAQNMITKQTEIDKLRAAVKVSDSRSTVALLELQSMMHKHGITEINLADVSEFIEKYETKLVPDKDNPQLARLIVKERETQNEHTDKNN